MLGLSGHTHTWRWKATGKHPAAADYIDLQKGTPVLDAVAEWMTKGYAALQRNGSETAPAHSFRFWLRSAKKGMLVCGLSRDSSDRFGRPFPLLIAGEGPVKQCEMRWPTLPVLLSRTWERIERIAAQRFDDVKSFSDEIGRLDGPENESDAPRPAPGDAEAGRFPDDRLNDYRTEWRHTGRIVIDLDGLSEQNKDPAQTALWWHNRLSTCCPEMPRAVFWGGTVRRAFLVVIRQPLATDDFSTLWSI